MSLELSSGKFEKLEHVVYGGEAQSVPLLVARKEGLTEDSNALLQAVNILGGTLENYDNSVNKLHERLALTLQDTGSGGVIVEDIHGAGALNIDPEKTKITVHGVDSWEIPTTLLFDMIYEWSQIDETELS